MHHIPNRPSHPPPNPPSHRPPHQSSSATSNSSSSSSHFPFSAFSFRSKEAKDGGKPGTKHGTEGGGKQVKDEKVRARDKGKTVPSSARKLDNFAPDEKPHVTRRQSDRSSPDVQSPLNLGKSPRYLSLQK